MITPSQQQRIDEAGLTFSLSSEDIEYIATHLNAHTLTDDQLLAFLQICNAVYRSGEPLVSDHCYDHIFLAELEKRHPQHPYLETIEPEPVQMFTGKTVVLPEKMLSTEKTYTPDGIDKWLSRLEKAAEDIGINATTLVFKATPKLDGYAAYDDGTLLYTRGDGKKGTDITRVFERGLQVASNNQRGLGAGEIVVSQRYFNEHLAEHFENARNFQASIIKEKELEQHTLDAIQHHAAVFYPFSQLPHWQGGATELRINLADIINTVLSLVDYDTDGVVFEVTDNNLKAHVGATRHHHRWQIAYKNNIETATVEVLSVTPQTSRSGRVNPVAKLQPTKLSGAIISRATAHHYGMVKEQGIGVGTIIELTRSGLVIPKIERVIIPKTPQIPDRCPSCNSELIWDNDYLYCPNTTQCPAQIENTIEHFFKTLANTDGFGQKTIQKLYAAGITSVYAIYQLTLEDLITMGFGEKTSQNLLLQRQRSQNETIEDWRFLGAFGIYRMGLGNCERLLQHYRLATIFQLTVTDIIAIEGFAEKTADAIIQSLAKIHEDFKRLYQLGFKLTVTPFKSEQTENSSPVFGKTIVFTGTMIHGRRDTMAQQAKRLGAKVASSVTGKTDFLVTGSDVGTAKITAATEKGVHVINEEAYLALITGTISV